VKIVGLIPSRLASTRLPKKALSLIRGIPLIAHVIKRSQMSSMLDKLYVATDSTEIANIAKRCNCEVLFTKESHPTGSDRIGEAAKSLDCDIVVNIQGDEALVHPEHINDSAKLLLDRPDIEVAMLATQFNKRESISDVKVVISSDNEILYFSRADIPFNSKNMHKAYHVVSFRKEMLGKFCALSQTPLELIESIEYMRLVESGFRIGTKVIDSNAISVDTSEDLAIVSRMMEEDDLYDLYKNDFSIS
jgi:3-deoxy-manno-octulosonate cytidylyltransferase (CMP-KDO synthetase)